MLTAVLIHSRARGEAHRRSGIAFPLHVFLYGPLSEVLLTLRVWLPLSYSSLQISAQTPHATKVCLWVNSQSNQVDNQDLSLLSSLPQPYLEPTRAIGIWELHLPTQDSFARNSSHKLLPHSVLAIEAFFFFYAMSRGSCRDSSLATLLRISDWFIYQLHCPQGSGTSWKGWQKTEEPGEGVWHILWNALTGHDMAVGTHELVAPVFTCIKSSRSNFLHG